MLKNKKYGFIILLVLLIACVSLIRMRYVFMNHTVYRRNIESININAEKVNVNELNRCSKLKTLVITEINNDTLENIKAFETLETLIMIYSKTDFSDTEMKKINSFPNLEFLGFDFSDVDLNDLNSNSVKKMSISRSNVSSLDKVTNCEILTELILDSVVIKDAMTSTDDTDLYKRTCFLNNSSDFACLDNIETLTIYRTNINDISGFIEMDSLKTFTISEGAISENDRKLLEDKGITVIEKNDSI